MITTTRNGFKVEDITFKNARRQSEISLAEENNSDTSDVVAPTSLTPEQVKSFFIQMIATAKDSNVKRVYSQTIKWVDELFELKRKIALMESREVKDAKEPSSYDEEEEV